MGSEKVGMMREKKIKCVILGDSISEGIGSKKMNYVAPLFKYAHQIGEIKNYAKTGTTIQYVNSILDMVLNECPDIVIIMYGSVDAQIRANIFRDRFKICSLIPKRYKIGGMLDPRAFYSKKWHRIVLDRVDNMIRFILKRLVLLTQGTIQLVSLERFRESYEALLLTLQKNDIKVLTVSTMFIDDRYFLNSSSEYAEYNKCMEEVAEKYNATYIDLFWKTKNIVERDGWDAIFAHDHFHPNERGYEFIGKILSEYLV